MVEEDVLFNKLNRFNFTTPEQSKRFLELKFKPEWADCYYVPGNDKPVVRFTKEEKNKKFFKTHKEYIPCWSTFGLVHSLSLFDGTSYTPIDELKISAIQDILDELDPNISTIKKEIKKRADEEYRDSIVDSIVRKVMDEIEEYAQKQKS